MDFDVDCIPRATLTPAQVNPFAVIELSQNYDATKGPRVFHTQYYLRCAQSQASNLMQTMAEFAQLGFADSLYRTYLAGTIQKKDGEYIVHPSNKKGFNFWVAEGLVGHLVENDATFPKIRSDVARTNKLYSQRLGIDDYELVNANIANLLTDPQKPALLEMSPTYLKKEQVWQVYRANSKADFSVMNYGYIWHEHTTFFTDPDTGIFYSLLNKPLTLEQSARISERNPLKLNTIVRSHEPTFREADKVEPQNKYFFDGTMLDLFMILAEGGVDVSQVLGE